MRTPLCILIAGLALGAATAMRAAERNVLVIAGQSNALNWHAAAAQLPASPQDERILFCFETGAPPDRPTVTPINATSGGRWTRLQVQRQEPFVRYEREFFGPEMTLARGLAASPGRPLAVIKLAYFGTTLARDWHPDATAGNQLYARLQRQVSAALAALRASGDEPRLVGFFWMQGETDGATAAAAEAYRLNLTTFISRLRCDLGPSDLPFVLGRVGPPPTKGYPYQRVVRDAQVGVAEALARVAWVDTDDLRRDTDGVHLLADGVLALGERMADAWLRLTSKVSHHE